ncbi:MAG: ABC transporter permease [Actinomycetota bacterium]|nr:MAG: ABC transporter permease [Actinomycetota bacterium]
MQQPGPAAPAPASRWDGAGSAAELAAANGLGAADAPLSLPRYLAALWQRRHFVSSLASARRRTQYSENRLGPVWFVLNPILSAAIYYLIFGVLLQTSRDIPNFPAFLVIGVFVFGFTTRCTGSGATAITSNTGLIRALHFPRATLPVAAVVVLFRDFLISLAVMAAIVLLMREPLTWNWLLVVPAITLLTMFNLGLALFLSRLVAQVRDINQVLPFIIRIWMYISGVFFSVTMVSDRLPHNLNWLLEANPMATYISLVRDCLMYSEVSQPWAWWAGAGWAIFALAGGFWFFYRAEERYGRS